MDFKFTDLDYNRTSESNCEFSSLLEFLVKVKSFVQDSQSTESNILFIEESLKHLTLHESDSGNNISNMVLWKCFHQVGMLRKVKKYVKLLLELLIIRIEIDKEDNQKLMEWYTKFIELRDCILVFCSKKEYAKELIPIMKSFVDILLKKLRMIDMKSYPREVHVHNLFVFIITELFPIRTLMNPIMEEIIKNSDDVTQDLSSQEATYLSEDIVNATECLNRYFNIIEVLDSHKMRKIDIEKTNDLQLIFKKLLRIEILPKFFSVRVVKLLDMMKSD
ncbi:uncharacterized protein LOC123313069 [Coccinella septempunctata]|uniref:uncharacterized protein LOC123313069 n=1 Tax=Coccinella septempunctata TaxID=41139 RepID=UPI001D09129B|nr:uncharacterized protein LOC123313069 [Coccinella septempunctata]